MQIYICKCEVHTMATIVTQAIEEQKWKGESDAEEAHEKIASSHLILIMRLHHSDIIKL